MMPGDYMITGSKPQRLCKINDTPIEKHSFKLGNMTHRTTKDDREYAAKHLNHNT